MRRLLAALCLTALALPATSLRAQAAEPQLRWRWVYAPCNFQVNERVDKLIALMRRAAKCGYNGLMVTDYKWGRFADRPAHYYTNLERTRKAAAEAGIELIPCVMPVGYSGSILMNNPDLAEGIAVRDCPMVVRGGKATQDWTQHDVVFNTLEYSTIRFYVGLWGGRTGRIWIDDVELRQAAGINLLRREGCPIKVTSDDGGTEYAEGRDFERWQYAKMGRDPWPGAFKVAHPEPPLVVAKGSRIGDGQRIKVSFYHTLLIHDGQVCCCLSHPELFKHLEQQVRDVRKHLAPKAYFMSHDEIRVAGQCELCRAGGRTAGQVLAENARRCTEIIRKVDPAAEVFVWSDMFDPHHNARDEYYLAGSTLEKSWEGLDHKVIVANWNAGKREQSLPFFAERGHRQIIAAYYDRADWRKDLRGWMDAAAKVKGVEGVIYTTWQNNYSDLEAFAEALKSR